MEDRSFLTNNHPTDGISDTFRKYIEALVEEVVLNGESFDAQKKWLRKNSEAEDVSYETIESNLNDLFEAIKELEEHESKSTERLIGFLAKECYLSEALVNKLIDNAAVVRVQKEAERKAQEEKKRKAQDEAKRKAKEKAERKAREEAECKAKEELEKKQTTGEINGHEYVDLGLPSGTMWAMCNVGATKPEEYGDYFAWGETGTKHIYDESAYKYAHGVLNKLTKYCGKSDYGSNGYTDSLAELQRSDDPASSWGSGWCTPTKAQWDELLRNTTSRWTTQNGVEGRLFTSKKNDQTLFLPAAGCRGHSSLNFPGINGYYWSSSLCTDNPDGALSFNFYNSGYCGIGSSVRSFGRSVRAAHSAC